MVGKLGLVCLSFVITITCLGCGGSDLPDLGSVQGVVTMDGNPLGNVRVSFQPEEGRGSSGTTDASGKYELVYRTNEPGALLGNHKVSITTVRDEAEEAEAIVPLSDDDSAPRQKPVRKFKETVPAKYNAKTELTAEVKSGSNTIDFELNK